VPPTAAEHALGGAAGAAADSGGGTAEEERGRRGHARVYVLGRCSRRFEL
jgi:hypothetical protein